MRDFSFLKIYFFFFTPDSWLFFFYSAVGHLAKIEIGQKGVEFCGHVILGWEEGW